MSDTTHDPVAARRIKWGQHAAARFVIYRDDANPRYEIGHAEEREEALWLALSYVVADSALISIYDRQDHKWIVRSEYAPTFEKGA